MPVNLIETIAVIAITISITAFFYLKGELIRRFFLFGFLAMFAGLAVHEFMQHGSTFAINALLPLSVGIFLLISGYFALVLLDKLMEKRKKTE
jgi:ABC-type transport system involved in multi-copper enzyme maturation permease subunit